MTIDEEEVIVRKYMDRLAQNGQIMSYKLECRLDDGWDVFTQLNPPQTCKVEFVRVDDSTGTISGSLNAAN